MITRSRILKLHPATLVLLSFLLAIGVGTLLLKMPFSTHTGHIPWVDALFTATSAVCVTGLIVVDTGSYFTGFGQGVILTLIQLGGLGVMTFAVMLFQWIGRSISFRQRMAIQDLFAHTPREDILGLVVHILVLTFTVEAVGALLLTVHWGRELPFLQALYTAVFHSVSAFCNAGFSLYSDSMMQYSNDILLNLTMCGLIVCGGFGFPVLYDLRQWFGVHKQGRARLSIQTKTVLLTSLILIVLGALMFAFLERQSLKASTSILHCVLAPVFQSITCRTAGFNTVDIGSLKEATLAMMIFLMFFGASPGSCGGGVKTTTLALITMFTWTRVKRRQRVNIFKKSIPQETVTRSLSLVLSSTGIISLILFLILVGVAVSGPDGAERQGFFLAYFFETVSAFGTVGLSMGVTPDLNTWGKCLIILMMIIGRVGVLTFSYIILGTGTAKGIEHAEENMMIG
ncbi:MAG: TrkH family potassium uptake protein [Deltaproteobacteria bacterium]|nr:TrkH family potassium uptake protein [Deltaproteobacteria bacterium]